MKNWISVKWINFHIISAESFADVILYKENRIVWHKIPIIKN